MNKAGKVYIVGLGPGGQAQLTAQVVKAIEESQVVVGYKLYVQLIEDLLAGKEVIASSMRKEIDRCQKALDLAKEGKIVSLVSSGDPGLYGMAGPVLELNNKEENPVEVEVVPGITAASMGAAVLGAPMMHDTAFISLSDLLTPWEIIEKRLHCAAEGDFVTALYNPRSKGRPFYINKARDIFLQYRKKETPVGIVRNAAREGQEKVVTTLEKMLEQQIDMLSVVIIGNSQTYIAKGNMITPRGYKL